MSATTHTNQRLRNLTAFRTIDIVTIATLGVAIGVAFWGWNQLYAVVSNISVFAFPPSSGLIAGPWLLGGVVGGLIVRRPGAAVLTELIAASISALLGNQWGFSTLGSGLVQGLGAELILGVFLWRRFGVIVAVMSGALAGAAGAVYEWYAYFSYWDLGYRLAYLGFFALSGAVIAGLGGWALVRALAVTGALDAFPVGREHHDRNLA